MVFLHSKQKPRKRFGQHFLNDGHIADRIIECSAIGSDDIVLEIGPGKGILTERILRRARAVFAVEIDRDLSETLRGMFGSSKGFHLIEADILKLNIGELFKDVVTRIKVVSNLPYNISSPVIELLIQNRMIISDAVIMLQREVARRLLSSPGSKDYGLTTLNLSLCAVGRKVMDVKPDSFYPPPKVMSTVVSLDFSENYRYPLDNARIFRKITGVAFRQRRKMIRNTLIPFFVSQGITKQCATEILLSTGVELQARPENLTVDNFVTISNAFLKMLKTPGIPEI